MRSILINHPHSIRLILAAAAALIVPLASVPTGAQSCTSCARGPISWNRITVRPAPGPIAYGRPMPVSTPMVVQRSPYSGMYQTVRPYGVHAVRFVAGTEVGNYLVNRGYPYVGRGVSQLRGGPVGAAFYPSCVGEGCVGWKRYLFP